MVRRLCSRLVRIAPLPLHTLYAAMKQTRVGRPGGIPRTRRDFVSGPPAHGSDRVLRPGWLSLRRLGRSHPGGQGADRGIGKRLGARPPGGVHRRNRGDDTHRTAPAPLWQCSRGRDRLRTALLEHRPPSVDSFSAPLGPRPGAVRCSPRMAPQGALLCLWSMADYRPGAAPSGGSDRHPFGGLTDAAHLLDPGTSPDPGSGRHASQATALGEKLPRFRVIARVRRAESLTKQSGRWIFTGCGPSAGCTRSAPARAGPGQGVVRHPVRGRVVPGWRSSGGSAPAVGAGRATETGQGSRSPERPPPLEGRNPLAG